MATINITYNGLSADYHGDVDDALTDEDLRRTAAEIVRAGELPGLAIPTLAADAFRDFMVDAS